jgi:hypothetical protein
MNRRRFMILLGRQDDKKVDIFDMLTLLVCM